MTVESVSSSDSKPSMLTCPVFPPVTGPSEHSSCMSHGVQCHDMLCFSLLCLFLLWWPVVHFRYSERSGGGPNLPFSLEGLCPHHGQTLAAQLAGGVSPRPQAHGSPYMPSSYPGNLPLSSVCPCPFCTNLSHLRARVLRCFLCAKPSCEDLDSSRLSLRHFIQCWTSFVL